MFNLNFKNCLTVVGRYLDNIILGTYEQIKNWTAKVIAMILRVRQKIRPGRHYPRRSYKPDKKWGIRVRLLVSLTNRMTLLLVLPQVQ